MTATEDHQFVVDTVAAFTEREVAAQVSAVEAAGDLGAVLPLLEHQGLTRLGVPVERGGSGVEFTTLLASLERIARRSAATADLVAALHVPELALARLAELPIPARRVVIDGPDLRLRRERGGWELEGTAPRVHHAVIAQRFLVLLDDAAVDIPAEDVAIGPRQRRTGLRGTDPRAVTVRGVAGDGPVLDGGVAAAARRLRWLTGAATGIGIGRQAIDEASAYLRGREQFGTVLADLPALRAMLAGMQQQVEGAAAQLAAVTERPGLAGDGLAAAAAVSAACDVALDSIQLHGGYGYITEYPVERLLRDAVSLRASLGGTRPLRQHAGRALAEAGR